LHPDSADSIYEQCNDKLGTTAFKTRSLLKKMNVALVCTTDDPIDTLEHHKKIAADNFSVKVIPAFRPDKAYAVEDTTSYNTYLDLLSKAASVEITDFSSLITALEKR